MSSSRFKKVKLMVNSTFYNFQNLGEYEYHYNLYRGAADRDYKFHAPELIADYVRKI